MASERDVLESLVQQTVHEVLFLGSPDASSGPEVSTAISMAPTRSGRSWTSEDATEGQASLLELLLTQDPADDSSSSRDKEQEDPAEEEDQGGVSASSVYCCARVLESHKWSLEHLQAEKAAIKTYLRKQQQSEASAQLYAVHEAYALLKLFVLERDAKYRQAQERASKASDGFRTHLHVLLTLYASYFQRAHGRQIASPDDVQPVQTLYALFLGRRTTASCVPRSTSTRA